MFYCETCRIEADWPTALGRSHGPCEVCGEVAVCHDRPCSTLPKRGIPPLGKPKPSEPLDLASIPREELEAFYRAHNAKFDQAL